MRCLLIPKVNHLLKTVQEARRAQDYGKMQGAADALQSLLGHSRSPESAALQGKLFYELHRAAYDKGFLDREGHPDRAQRHFLQSCKFAYKAQRASEGAGDQVGVLYARMSAWVLLQPVVDPHNREYDFSSRKNVVEVLREVLLEGTQLVAEATGADERTRAARLTFKTLWHLLNTSLMWIETWHGVGKEDIAQLLARLQGHELYDEYKDTPKMKGLIQEALPRLTKPAAAKRRAAKPKA